VADLAIGLPVGPHQHVRDEPAVGRQLRIENSRHLDQLDEAERPGRLRGRRGTEEGDERDGA
jgi:hypothetical protein